MKGAEGKPTDHVRGILICGEKLLFDSLTERIGCWNTSSLAREREREQNEGRWGRKDNSYEQTKKNLEKTESSIYILTLNLKRFFFQVEDLNFFDE